MIYNNDLTKETLEDFIGLVAATNPDEIRYNLQTTAESLLPGISTFLLNEVNDMPDIIGSLIKSATETNLIRICMENGLKLDKLMNLGDEPITSPINIPTVDRLREIKADMRAYCPVRGTGIIENSCDNCVYVITGKGWKSSVQAFVDVMAEMLAVKCVEDVNVCINAINIMLDITQIIKFALDEANKEE